MKEIVWKTLDGRQIPVSKMEDLHLVNTIAMLRRGKRASLKLDAMEKEAKKRKLSEELINSAPHPWRDVDGKWKRGLAFIKGILSYKPVGR